MIIYTITSLIDGKQYVGQTTQLLQKRMYTHKHAAKTKNYPLYNAIRKYGLKNFVVEQVDSADSIEELNRREIEWICHLNTVRPAGYNLTTGGGMTPFRLKVQRPGMTGKHHSLETRQQMSQTRKGRKFPPRSKEHCLHISQSNKGRIPWNRGIAMSEETKHKISASKIGKSLIHTPAITYEGSPCKRCASTIRYRSIRTCVQCHRLDNFKRHQNTKLQSS
jgi:group I intron endonuclease